MYMVHAYANVFVCICVSPSFGKYIYDLDLFHNLVMNKSSWNLVLSPMCLSSTSFTGKLLPIT